MVGRFVLEDCDTVRPAADSALCLACAEPSTAADACQRPLRSRCQARLRPGVDMTSNVKGGPQIFLGLPAVLVLGISAEAEPARGDGCSGCSPWGGSHLPCLRRAPASVSARGA